jgi:putative (di)nucleoside polyphosphate hydrolase
MIVRGSLMPAAGQFFRAGVGALIADEKWRVLAFQRADVLDAWQLPQGGIEAEEEPIDAIWREIAEETGLAQSDLRLIERYPDLLAYELPPHLRSEKTGRGQVQYWFIFRSTGVGAVPVRTGREFTTFQWMSFDRLIATTATFRHSVYEKLSRFLGRLRANE